VGSLECPLEAEHTTHRNDSVCTDNQLISWSVSVFVHFIIIVMME
jgi:hypothetical protein